MPSAAPEAGIERRVADKLRTPYRAEWLSVDRRDVTIAAFNDEGNVNGATIGLLRRLAEASAVRELQPWGESGPFADGSRERRFVAHEGAQRGRQARMYRTMVRLLQVALARAQARATIANARKFVSARFDVAAAENRILASSIIFQRDMVEHLQQPERPVVCGGVR